MQVTVWVSNYSPQDTVPELRVVLQVYIIIIVGFDSCGSLVVFGVCVCVLSLCLRFFMRLSDGTAIVHYTTAGQI